MSSGSAQPTLVPAAAAADAGLVPLPARRRRRRGKRRGSGGRQPHSPILYVLYVLYVLYWLELGNCTLTGTLCTKYALD
jgi:hypothetical protein